ncbi:MAG: hypothetical protein IT293_09890 [Deltaproteobacteria bacterium]|nr:hypothetical protein [Deltaproteobacteria bacterium]
MRSFLMTGLVALTMAATAAHADETAVKPKAAKSARTTTRSKPQPMSEAKRRDLERRIEALEQKYEMQYHETDSPTGAPGAKPAVH